MKIRIVIPKDLWGKDLEIWLQAEGEIECHLEDTNESVEAHYLSEMDFAVLYAYDSIFTSEILSHLKRIDGEGLAYATPGDVREAIDFMYSHGFDSLPTTPRIGRVLRHKLGLKPGVRRSEGIPYYWNENQSIVEGWMI